MCTICVVSANDLLTYTLEDHMLSSAAINSFGYIMNIGLETGIEITTKYNTSFPNHYIRNWHRHGYIMIFCDIFTLLQSLTIN